MEDCQIVDLFWRRSEDAVAALSGKYAAYCYAVAWNILSNAEDAEECVNDTWLGAWNAMPPHRPSRLGAFVDKITRNLAFNRHRARYANKRGGGQLPLVLDELEQCVPVSPSAAQAVEDAELERLVDRFLRTLPQRDCNIFLRRYWYADALEAIANRYGLKVNTVKTSLFRSRGKLKRYLETEGIFL